MGKGNGLAIFALLIAFGGLGLGVYSVFVLPVQNTNPSEIFQMWYVGHGTYYTGGSFADIPDMEVNISVSSGENIMILYSGQFWGDVGYLIGGVRLMIDTFEVPSSRREFNVDGSNGVAIGYSISTNVLISADNLLVGQYEIGVQAYGAGSGNDRITGGLLVIYTFI